MKEVLMEDQKILFSTVEKNRAASKLCLRLFPQWCQSPTQGELQRIILESRKLNASETAILQAGRWWLWVRELAIENTFSKPCQHLLMDQAIAVALGKQPKIHFASARSPELLHAQVSQQGDKSLPRSRKAIEKLGQICTASSQFLPTSLTIIFADLAIDNLDEIEKHCNVKLIIEENLKRIAIICSESGIADFKIIRMSQLVHPKGKLEDILDQNGSPKIGIDLNERAKKLIETATRESLESHQRMFGWTKEQSLAHNQSIAITMGLVGQAAQLLSPPSILIHNESFISRGSLNNLFTDPNHPLPVICLKDLLENKKTKK